MTDQNMLKDIFDQHTQVRDVRIIKGNTQGQFDRFCYAFMTIKATEEYAQSIINKVSNDHPNWRMNIKQDNQNQMMNKTMQPIRQAPNRNFNQTYIPQDMMIRPQSYSNQSYTPSNSYQQSSNQITSEKITGEKIYKIFVREIWLGGIPEMCDQNYLASLMSQFGTVDNMQIFPKFAFVRFKMAQQATNAYQRASRIYNMFGQASGFRITFSDPSRRAQIVSNHYDYERMSVFIPVLFLGFPPVTSATIELDHMKSICEKYGTIVNYYMKKNNNTQTRSYFLFTYDNLKSALRAKQQLSRRRDLLGDKRVEVTLLLNESQLMKGRDLSQTQRLFPDTISTTNKFANYDKSKKNPGLMFPNQPIIHQQQQIGYQPNYQTGGYFQPSHYSGMYPQQFDKKNQPRFDKSHQWMPPKEWQRYDQKRQTEWNQPIPSIDPSMQQYERKYYPKNQQFDVFNLVQSVLDKGSDSPLNGQSKIKKPLNNQYSDPSQIISKMLGTTQKKNTQTEPLKKQQLQENQAEKEQDPAWSGILTWKGTKKANIDGHFSVKTDEDCEFQDYNVNLFFSILPKDIVLKEKLFKLILEPMNSISSQAFQQYIALLKDKVGVSITAQYIIYVMGKCKQADETCKIEENQLLMIMEKKIDVYPLIKDKLSQI